MVEYRNKKDGTKCMLIDKQHIMSEVPSENELTKELVLLSIMIYKVDGVNYVRDEDSFYKIYEKVK